MIVRDNKSEKEFHHFFLARKSMSELIISIFHCKEDPSHVFHYVADKRDRSILDLIWEGCISSFLWATSFNK